MTLNVFKRFPRPKYYYLTHPWKWFSDTWYNLKEAWLRAIRGYSEIDWFNMNDWLRAIIPDMLRYMAKNCHAYPGNEEFSTPEKWEDYLNSIADVFDSLDIDEWIEKNEYQNDWFNDNSTTYSREELSHLYYNRLEELMRERDALIIDCFTSLAKVFDALWD